MRTIADALVTAMGGVVPETFYEVNDRPSGEIIYPYVVWTYAYTPVDGDRNKYDVTLECDIFARDIPSLLATEETLTDQLTRYRGMEPDTWSMSRVGSSVPVPTLVEGLYRRLVTFPVGMTLREKG